MISGESSAGRELDARFRGTHATKPTEATATEHRIAEIKIAKKADPLNDWPENQMKSPKVPKRKLAQSPRSKSDTIETVIRLEKRVWEVAQQRNAAEFKKLVPADAVMIFQSGIVLQPEYLLTMNARTISRYEIREHARFHAECDNRDSVLRSTAPRRTERRGISFWPSRREHHLDPSRQTLGRNPKSRDPNQLITGCFVSTISRVSTASKYHPDSQPSRRLVRDADNDSRLGNGSHVFRWPRYLLR